MGRLLTGSGCINCISSTRGDNQTLAELFITFLSNKWTLVEWWQPKTWECFCFCNGVQILFWFRILYFARPCSVYISENLVHLYHYMFQGIDLSGVSMDKIFFARRQIFNDFDDFKIHVILLTFSNRPRWFLLYLKWLYKW